MNQVDQNESGNICKSIYKRRTSRQYVKWEGILFRIMAIEQQPFVKYNLEKNTDSFTVRVNKEERELLEKCKEIIEQTKDSTAMKIVFIYGAYVLHSKETRYLLETIYSNKRKNKRLGIIDFD